MTYLINPINRKLQDEDDDSSNSCNHNTNHQQYNHKQPKKKRNQSINIHESPFIIDIEDDEKNVYVDTNYTHYKITVRKTDTGLK